MPDRRLEGRAHVFGDEVDTDVIVPSQYMDQPPATYAAHAMEPVDPDFAERVRPGDIVVAGRHFGIGSSREHAVIALQELGIAAVVAESFARIFFRNAINEGLPAVRVDAAVVDAIQPGETLRIDLDDGTIEKPDGTLTASFEPYDEPVRSILEAGGVVEYLEQQ